MGTSYATSRSGPSLCWQARVTIGEGGRLQGKDGSMARWCRGLEQPHHLVHVLASVCSPWFHTGYRLNWIGWSWNLFRTGEQCGPWEARFLVAFLVMDCVLCCNCRNPRHPVDVSFSCKSFPRRRISAAFKSVVILCSLRKYLEVFRVGSKGG